LSILAEFVQPALCGLGSERTGRAIVRICGEHNEASARYK
jgi:hypothetical protein